MDPAIVNFLERIDDRDLGLAHPDGSLTTEGRLFHGMCFLRREPGTSKGFGGPLLTLLFRMQETNGLREAEIIAWRILSSGLMSSKEPHIRLELRGDPRPPEHLPHEPFDRTIVQRFLCLTGIIHHSRYEEYQRSAVSPLKAYRTPRAQPVKDSHDL